MELKLTEEQIELAANAMRDNWQVRFSWKMLAEIAAPYLQAPWDPPTAEENHRAGELHRVIGKIPLADFVSRRNAALLPKPVDPRREKIAAVILPTYMDQEKAESIVDRVIAALDGK
jgi:hypothetical protein